jgi:hypothetical protein
VGTATTIAVAITVAIASGLGASWFAMKHDRQERHRDRLIDTADEFARAMADALLATSALSIEAEGEPPN